MTQNELLLFIVIGAVFLVLWSLRNNDKKAQIEKWRQYEKLIYRDRKKKSFKQDSKGDSDA